MKCEYCGAEDHLITACGKRSNERTFEAGGGCLIAIVLVPFYIVGWVVGLISSAFIAGFRFSSGAWPEAWKKVRGNKDAESSV